MLARKKGGARLISKSRICPFHVTTPNGKFTRLQRVQLLSTRAMFLCLPGLISEARLKELTPAMPVIFIKAIPVDKQETKGIYECPVYKTKQRGPTYVWTFNLKTKEKSAKWVLGGVGLLLQT